jgi:hypothetical protein
MSRPAVWPWCRLTMSDRPEDATVQAFRQGTGREDAGMSPEDEITAILADPEAMAAATGRRTRVLEDEVAWLTRAMWLLLVSLGGKVEVSRELWEAVPDRPELTIDQAGEVMRWSAEGARIT